MPCLPRRLRHRQPSLLRDHSMEVSQKLYLLEKALRLRLLPMPASPTGHDPRQMSLLSVCSLARFCIVCSIRVGASTQLQTEVSGRQGSIRPIAVRAAGIPSQLGVSTEGVDRLAAFALAILHSKW